MTQPEDIGTVVATLACGNMPYATGTHIDVGGGPQLHRDSVTAAAFVRPLPHGISPWNRVVFTT